MKKIAVILLSAILLSGCGSSAVEQSVPVNTSQTLFERHAIDGRYSILADLETRVCYLEYNYQSGYAGFGGITVMLNENGTLKLWEE